VPVVDRLKAWGSRRSFAQKAAVRTLGPMRPSSPDTFAALDEMLVAFFPHAREKRNKRLPIIGCPLLKGSLSPL
jgi:hypothetical protein